MPIDAAERRQRDRLGEDLPQDVAPPRAERLAQPDLARPLADDHQHDVHDDDAADDEREADDADQDREDAGRGLAVDVRGTCPTRATPKLSGSFGRSRRSIRSATRRVVHRRLRRASDRSAGRSARSDWREPNTRWNAGSGMTANSSCDWPKIAPFFGATPTTRKWTPASVIDLVDRIDRAEQPVGRVPAENRDRPAGVELARRDRPAALDRRRRHAVVFLGDAADLNAVERLAAVLRPGRRLRPRPSPARCSGRTRGSPSASSSVTRGLLCARSCSSSVRVRPRALHGERVGARTRDWIASVTRRVQSLDERHHRDDRRHRDDVAEDGQQRPQLVRPDRLERDADGLEELVHQLPCGGAAPCRRRRRRLETLHGVAVAQRRAPTRTAR